jgi:hypothetical protein
MMEQAAVLLLPVVERCIADTDLPADFFHRVSGSEILLLNGAASLGRVNSAIGTNQCRH